MDMEQNNKNTFLAEQPEWKLLLAKLFATNELKPFWAEKYFRDEIIESMGLEQIQSVGLKR